MASGLYLKDSLAPTGGYTAEWTAALKVSGRRKLEQKKPPTAVYGWYGNDVMEFAAEYQEQIDIINKMASPGFAESRQESRRASETLRFAYRQRNLD